MNASKENAVKAGECLAHLKSQFLEQWTDPSLKDDFQFLSDFLEAATRKLPKETSFVRAKKKNLEIRSRQTNLP